MTRAARLSIVLATAIAGLLVLALLDSGDALALVGVIVVAGLLIAAILAIFVVDSGWRSVRLAREIFRKRPLG